MTTPITARQLIEEWLRTGNLDQECVSMADYNRMATQADHNSDKVQELKAVVGELKAILQRWATISPKLATEWSGSYVKSRRLQQLIADTQAIMGDK